jgi:hypothetical protein
LLTNCAKQSVFYFSIFPAFFIPLKTARAKDFKVNSLKAFTVLAFTKRNLKNRHEKLPRKIVKPLIAGGLQPFIT